MVLTDADFDAKTAKGVVLVDFWASWCGPCQVQGPIVEKVGIAMSGKTTVGKCNVDNAPKSANRFGVQSIPTLVILKDNREVERFVGVQSEQALRMALEKHLQ